MAVQKRDPTSMSSSKRDLLMGRLEEIAMRRGLMPLGIYEDGRSWKHGQPSGKRPPRTSKSRELGRKALDALMGRLEGMAMHQGLMPLAVYEDGRTWRHGAPGGPRKRSSRKKQTSPRKKGRRTKDGRGRR